MHVPVTKYSRPALTIHAFHLLSRFAGIVYSGRLLFACVTIDGSIEASW